MRTEIVMMRKLADDTDVVLTWHPWNGLAPSVLVIGFRSGDVVIEAGLAGQVCSSVVGLAQV